MVLKRSENHLYSIEDGGDYFYALSNYDDAKNFKVMRLEKDGFQNINNWEDVIEVRDTHYIEDMLTFNEFIVIQSRYDGIPIIEVFNFANNSLNQIDMKDEVYDLGLVYNNNFDSSYTQSLPETSAEPDPTAALVIPKGSSDRPGMALLEGGSFQMGSLEGEDDEWPTRQIELASFYLDVHEVTNADYAQCSECMRGYGGFDTTLPEQPVVYVDWENSARYCASIGKRLPTEAEWEYATQAGSVVENSDSVLAELREQAWFEMTSQDLRSAAVVGQRQPNAWGLYDLQGNVIEWTADWYAPYDQAKLQNPKGPEAPPNPTYPQKVARGGAWQGLFGRATEAGLRSSRRYGLAAWTQAFNLGFRCAADAL